MTRLGLPYLNASHTQRCIVIRELSRYHFLHAFYVLSTAQIFISLCGLFVFNDTKMTRSAFSDNFPPLLHIPFSGFLHGG